MHPPSVPRRPRRLARWRVALWLCPVLLLHGLALYWLAHALRMGSPDALPPVLYTRVLLPQAPAPTRVAATPAAPAEPTMARHDAGASVAAVTATDPRGSAGAHGQASGQAPPSSASAPRRTAAPAQPPAAASTPARRASTASSAPHPLAAASGASAAPQTPAKAAASAPRPADPAAGWPPSTRLEFALRGYYRGELHGNGELEWRRQGDQYQLRLAGSALIDVAYTSVGRIDGDWLQPRSYVEQVLMRRKSVDFDRDAGVLRFSALPSTLPISPRLLDSASVFMQLAQLLHGHGADFDRGRHLRLQLARPSGTTWWDFRVEGRESVDTGAGRLDCWHLIYDPPPDAGLGAEVWLAPQLQDLPVQIRLRHSADEYLLFTLRRALQQAPAEPASAAAAPHP